MNTFTRFCLAQINPTVGDVAGNAAIIIAAIDRARGQGADAIAFPELALSGYPPEDLLLRNSFIQLNNRYLKDIIKASKNIVSIVGFPFQEKGKRFNAAAVINNGSLKYVYRKMFLPNYGVFDEKRYFHPGVKSAVFALPGKPRFGVNICEDIWEDNGPFIEQARFGKAAVLVNISSSPYHSRKLSLRQNLLRGRARQTGSYILYLNLVGGQDELVFDGGSFAVNPAGAIISRAKTFKEDMLYVDIPDALPERSTRDSRAMQVISLAGSTNHQPKPVMIQRIELIPAPLEEMYQALVTGLRDYIGKNKFTKVVLGLSGGIDSSLVAIIAADAIGAENVIGITMPSIYSSAGTQRDAYLLARNLGMTFKRIPIQALFARYCRTLKPHFMGYPFNSAEENLQARIRGNLLMAFSNKFGWLVLTTGNKSEISVGYCTLYGDTAGGFAVIKDVPKTTVYKLARYRNRIDRKRVIPESVFLRPPTAELKPHQTDQDTLPPYNGLDRVIEQYVEQNKDLRHIRFPDYQ